MDESILASLRKLLGGAATDYNYFDQDIMIHANTYLANLVQMGVGTPEFILTDEAQTWHDFLGDDYPANRLPQVRSYIYMQVKLIFDPPVSSIANEKMKEAIKELEWRLNVEIDPGIVNL